MIIFQKNIEQIKRDIAQMNDQIAILFRNLSENFAKLADEIEKRDSTINSKLEYLESTSISNRQALKDAADAILGRI